MNYKSHKEQLKIIINYNACYNDNINNIILFRHIKNYFKFI